jgi:hypothetical protein
MTYIDVTKDLAEILTSALGKGWGWADIFAAAKVLRVLNNTLNMPSSINRTPKCLQATGMVFWRATFPEKFVTREKERGGLGLAAQRSDIEAFGAREGLNPASLAAFICVREVFKYDRFALPIKHDVELCNRRMRERDLRATRLDGLGKLAADADGARIAGALNRVEFKLD